jgi:Helix-turn-helix domain
MPELASPWPAYKRIPDFVPVPLRTRRDGWTAVRQGEFVGWLAQSGSVAEAAAWVGCSRASAYALRRRAGAEGFAAAWAVAASGGRWDLPARKLTRGEVVRAADVGLVRVLMRRGRYVGTRVVPQVSALLRQLAQFDRACAAIDAEGLW